MKKEHYFSHMRTDILSLMPKGAKRVLDVGCGNGCFGKELKKTGIEVVGIESDAVAAKEAEANLDRVYAGDIENLTPPFSDGYFDCIIFADILEHLRKPQDALNKYRQYLSDGGCVIGSIPNVRYYKVIIRLLRGSWDYVDAGILDESHLRFFTLVNIKEMFEKAGYKIEGLKRNLVAARGFKLINMFFCGLFRDFLTYQYYIVAKKDLTDKTYSRKRKIYKF